MILKKTNAVLGLLSSLAVVVHMGYNCFSYLTFYYNPGLSLATSVPLMILVCAHAICGMCSVFLLGDGTRLDLYPKKNRRTIIQRISAALIFPLLIVHINTFEAMSSCVEKGIWIGFAMLLVLQLLFYVVITVHTFISFSKACITLGFLTDEKKVILTDRINAELTLDDVAERIGKSKQSIENWENGKTPIKYSDLLKLSEIYEMPVKYIRIPEPNQGD